MATLIVSIPLNKAQNPDTEAHDDDIPILLHIHPAIKQNRSWFSITF